MGNALLRALLSLSLSLSLSLALSPLSPTAAHSDLWFVLTSAFCMRCCRRRCPKDGTQARRHECISDLCDAQRCVSYTDMWICA